MTEQLQCSGQIGISCAGSAGQVCINVGLSRGFDAHPKNRSGKMGIFQKLSNKIQLSLITVAPKDAQETRNFERGDILKQRAYKHRK